MRFGIRPSQLFSLRLLIVISVILIGLVYIWRLGTSPPALSSGEATSRNTAQSLHKLASNPIYLPHSLGQYILLKTAHGSILLLRMVSSVFALIFIYCFYKLVRNWFGLMVGLMGTAIFITTPLIINMARSASWDIMLLAPLLIIASYFWLRRTTENKNAAFVVMILSTAISLYIPLGFVFVSVALAVTWNDLREELRRINAPVLVIGFLVSVLLLIPLFRALILSPGLLRDVFALPGTWHGIKEQIISSGWSIGGVFWHTRLHSDLFISKLPLLNIAQIVLSLFGAYAMWQQARREFIWLLSIFVLGTLAAAVSGNPNFLVVSLIASSIYVCAGLRYLYIEWRTIFPINPLPRTLALFLMAVLVFVNIAYGLRYSLIAWPKTEETRSAYVLK